MKKNVNLKWKPYIYNFVIHLNIYKKCLNILLTYQGVITNNNKSIDFGSISFIPDHHLLFIPRIWNMQMIAEIEQDIMRCAQPKAHTEMPHVLYLAHITLNWNKRMWGCIRRECVFCMCVAPSHICVVRVARSTSTGGKRRPHQANHIAYTIRALVYGLIYIYHISERKR